VQSLEPSLSFIREIKSYKYATPIAIDIIQ
jgi:hypothetical protein